MPITPLLAADCVVFDERGRLLLIRRRNPPFQGQFALPGGFVGVGETVEAAAVRELKEETGLDGTAVKLVGVYSDPKLDPRGHTVSIAFCISVPRGAEPVAATMPSTRNSSTIGGGSPLRSTTARSSKTRFASLRLLEPIRELVR